jgi:hypothetical protein
LFKTPGFEKKMKTCRLKKEAIAGQNYRPMFQRALVYGNIGTLLKTGKDVLKL